jgi:hypothetical protein
VKEVKNCLENFPKENQNLLNAQNISAIQLVLDCA